MLRPEVPEAGEKDAGCEHFVAVEFGDWDGKRWVCRAAADAPCKAVFDCECESWSEQGIGADGLPVHLAYDTDEDHDVWHVGRFGDHCNLTEWFDESDSLFVGSVEVPVVAEFDFDHYDFRQVAAPTSTDGAS